VHVTVGAFVVVAAAVSVGSVVQGSVGFGLNLLAAPVVAVVEPKAIPATLVLIAFPLAVGTFVREHHALQRRTLAWMLVGAVPGTLVGLLIVGLVDETDLAVLVGAITLAGVALSAASPPVPVTRFTSAVAGLLSQVFGTATSVGGPPVALLFQHHDGPSARSTLSAFFATAALFSLLGYTASGHIRLDQVALALSLLPFVAAGWWASRHLHALVDAGWLRPAVLALSALAGSVAILHAVL